MNRKYFYGLAMVFLGMLMSPGTFAGTFTGQQTPWPHVPTYVSGMKCGEGGRIECQPILASWHIPYCCTPNANPECIPVVPLLELSGTQSIVCIDDPATCFCEVKDCGSNLTNCSAFYIDGECHKKCSSPGLAVPRSADQ